MAAQVTDTSVMVSWTPPTDATNVIGYRIFYDGGRGEESIGITGSGMRTVTLSKLTTGRTYSVTVVATTDDLPSEVIGPEMVELGMSHEI